MKEQHLDNHKRPRRAGNTAGSALITVLGVSLIMMLTGATLLVMSRQSIHRIKRTVKNSQAQAVAEAGIADMAAKLGSNYVYWQNNFHSNTFFSNATYYVTTQTQLNGNVLIISDGIYLDASNRTIMELLGTLQTHYNDLYDLNSAIMSGGDITLSSGAYHMHGNIAANGAIVEGAGTIDGTVSNNVTPPLVLPTFNFDSYRQMAINNGTYLEGTQTLSGTPIASPANGILYVNGDLTIEHNSSFIGTIVVNGDIDINNNFTQTNFPGTTNMPSLLSTGNITLGNHGVYYGVMYGSVSFDAVNNIEIHGGVISCGETTINNHIHIWPGAGYPVWDPLNPEVPPEVIVGGWLK